jgi:replicative DNA helicase
MSEIYHFAEGFQLKILALMARDKGSYVSYQDVLKPKYFKKDIHIDMARILHEYYEGEMQRAKIKGTEINAPTMEVLWEEVRKLTVKNPKKAKIKEQYQDCVVDLVQADLSDAEYIKENLVKFGKDAAIEHAILESVTEIEKGRESGIVDYSMIEEKISNAIRVGEDISDLGSFYFERAETRMNEYASGNDGIRRVPTGMSGLDRIMGGGLGDGELGVVIAPPNRGKSFALTNIGAGAILEGFNVAHYTLEMPERQVEKRYDNRLLQKDTNYLKENGSKAFQALINMQKFIKGDLVVKKYRTNEASVNTLRSHLTRLHMEKNFKPDLIIVDYADLLQPRRTYSDKRFELESVYLDLRDLGTEYGCPVWTASQANRGALDKKVITIGDLAEAFNKANIADFMVALCQTVEEKEDGVMRWHVAKQRDGEANLTLEGDIDYLTAFMTVMVGD